MAEYTVRSAPYSLWEVVKEIVKGKNLRRALFLSSLRKVFNREAWLRELPYSVLEIGAEKASHQRAYPKSWVMTRSNYVPMEGVEIVIDGNKKFPVASNSFDGVVIFNTIPVIDNYMNCLNECVRTAREFVIFNVPLIGHTARHPGDFNRFPIDRLIEILGKLEVKSYTIYPIGGSFSSAVTILDPYFKPKALAAPFAFLALLLDKLDKKIGYECPTQFLVVIRK